MFGYTIIKEDNDEFLLLKAQLKDYEQRFNTSNEAFKKLKKDHNDVLEKYNHEIQTVDKLKQYLAKEFPSIEFTINLEHDYRTHAYITLTEITVQWINGPSKDNVKIACEASQLWSGFKFQRSYSVEILMEESAKIMTDNDIKVDVNPNNIRCMKIADCSIKQLAITALDCKDL